MSYSIAKTIALEPVVVIGCSRKGREEARGEAATAAQGLENAAGEKGEGRVEAAGEAYEAVLEAPGQETQGGR